MMLAYPIALILLLPLAYVALATVRRGPVAAPGLPGGWARLVAPALRPYLARYTVRSDLSRVYLCLAIAVCLIVALSRPLIGPQAEPDAANFAGRVIVFDVQTADAMRRQHIFAGRLMDSGPPIATAIVAVAGDAYSIVPLTTDRNQIDRYVNVLEPAMMPQSGRALQAGLGQAEQILNTADILVGQIVLITEGRPPDEVVEVPTSRTPRVIALTSGDRDAWKAFADASGAQVAGADDAARLAEAMRARIARLARTAAPGGAVDLAPLFVALAMALWLALFRRRADR